MRLSELIKSEMEQILVNWEASVRTTIPQTETMPTLVLRDHVPEILLAVAACLESSEGKDHWEARSKEEALPTVPDTAAAEHGNARHLAGFDLHQIAVEFCALRATVLRLWLRQAEGVDTAGLQDIVRFGECLDQALAESVASYMQIVESSRDMFLGILGHDLRNPLGALDSCLYLLSKPEVNEFAKQGALRIANRSVTAIAEMVTNLLEYTRTRLGQGIEVIPQAADLGALCKEVFEEAQAAHPHHVLVCDVAGSLVANFDPSRMRQVLTNLVCNAIQHGDPSTAVVLKAWHQAGKVGFAVKNRGTPIPPDALRTIFEPMTQQGGVDPAKQQATANSLGLGLFIAHEIVSRHGGTIEVTSSEEEGTEFVVRFNQD